MYTINLTQKELEIVSQALDTYARIGTKQYAMILSQIHGDKNGIDFTTAYSLEQIIRQLEGCDLPPNASYGINQKQVPENFQIAWRIYTSLKKATTCDCDGKCVECKCGG